MQHFLNPLTVTSFDIHCHGLDPLAQHLFIVHVMLEHGPLLRASQTTIISNDP
jgi:hypothetical protein